MIDLIQKAAKISSVFTTKLSPDAMRAKILFQENTNVKGFNSTLIVSAFRRGVIVNLKINDFQILIEMTENISLPIEVPSPVGMVGGIVSLNNLTSKDNKMNANFSVDLQIGLFGTFNLFTKSISYTDEYDENSSKNSLIGDINEIKFYALIELIKSDCEINENEISFLNDFLVKSGLTSEKKDFFINVLKSKDPIHIDYSVFHNTAYAVPLLNALIELSSKDGEVSLKEFQFIEKYAKNAGVEGNEVFKNLSKSFNSDNDLIYVYKGNPDATYKKNQEGKWMISNKNTNGYVLINDPDGKRTEVLNSQAVIKS